MSVKTHILERADAAGEIIRRGGLVAFPTETVFGLGADARNSRAVARIYEAKGRPQDNPLIVHIADTAQLGKVAAHVPQAAARLMAAFSPGPLTVVVPKAEGLAPAVSAGLSTVAVRIPAHPLALAVLQAAACPVAAPSANRSGRPSATRWEDVLRDLDGRVEGILKGSAPEIGIESTVVDCTSSPPAILRAGGLSLERLRTIVPDLRAQGDQLAASPGTRHPHYAPSATVTVVQQATPRADAAYIGPAFDSPENGYGLVRVVDSTEEYAHALYAFFREADQLGLAQVHCAQVAEEGLGVALMDRIRRASEAGR